MIALVVGCGSIGKRHIKNLLKEKEVSKIFVYSRRPDCLKDFFLPTHGDKWICYSRESGNPLTHSVEGRVELINDYSGITADFAVICNETSSHISTALKLAKKGMHLFIEKPLSHELKGVSALKKIINQRKLKVFVGYNLRFLKAVEYAKDILASGVLGDLCSARIEVGQYLPDWRAGRDYRETYSASREKGGGVALDLSHELDYMCYFFGTPVKWEAMKANSGALKIDSEDIFEGVYGFSNGLICSVHMDYLRRAKRRMLSLIAGKGELTLDFIAKEIKADFIGGKKSRVIRSKEFFDIDKTYRDEIKDFINSIKKNQPCSVGLEDGERVLKLIGDSHV